LGERVVGGGRRDVLGQQVRKKGFLKVDLCGRLIYFRELEIVHPFKSGRTYG
jgi:hypothetical protein